MHNAHRSYFECITWRNSDIRKQLRKQQIQYHVPENTELRFLRKNDNTHIYCDMTPESRNS
jgi:hypothetical protein